MLAGNLWKNPAGVERPGQSLPAAGKPRLGLAQCADLGPGLGTGRTQGQAGLRARYAVSQAQPGVSAGRPRKIGALPGREGWAWKKMFTTSLILPFALGQEMIFLPTLRRRGNVDHDPKGG